MSIVSSPERELVLSAIYGNLNNVKNALNKIKLKSQKIDWLNYVIFEAIQHRHLDIVQYLISYYKANGIIPDYAYLVGEAAANNQLEIVKFLINDGFDYLTPYDIKIASNVAYNLVNLDVSDYLDWILKEMK